MGRAKKRVSDNDASPPIGGGQPFGAPKQMSDGALKTSLVQRVYETIMESLDAGELPPGSRIIASELATRLNLSRAPVREALAVLAGQGLVELLPDRGAILRPMSRHELAGIYEVSGPVAAIGLRAAAPRVGEGDNAAAIRRAMQSIRDAADERPLGVGFYLVLNDFHYLVNAIAEKPHVDVVLRAVNIEYWNRLLATAIDLDRHVGQYVRNYERMTDALLEGDGRTAESVMRFHAEWCVSLLEDANAA